MRRNGCTSLTAARVLCAAAGVAFAASMASAQDAALNAAGVAASASKSTATVNADRLLGETAGGFAEFFGGGIGTDGTFCPPGSTPEGEPCVVPVVVPDVFNGGCNTSAANPPLTPIAVGQIICGQSVRNLDPDGVTRRDTDWYEVQITVADNYVVEVLTDTANVAGGIIGTAGGPLLNPTCAQVAQINPVVAGVGGGTTTPVPLQVGTYWLFASSSTAVTQPCFEYTIRIVSESEFFGACCLTGGSCQDLTEEACVALAGVFQGTGTDCATTECPEIFPPANDTCDAAEAVALNVDIPGTTLGSGPEAGLPPCGGGEVTGGAVWYSYDANALGFSTVTASLCNTANLPDVDRLNDSVINVYTNDFAAFCLGTFCCVAGNDDADCELWSEVSFCADAANAATTSGIYFIVVSGFGGEVGDFILNVTNDGVSCSSELCIECDGADALEGELCPPFPDAFNGGCNSDGANPPLSPLALGQTVCGTSATDDIGGTRDTDWYEITIPADGNYEVVFEAGFEGVAGFIGAVAGTALVNPTCAQIAVIAVLTTPAPCEEGVVGTALTAGTYWVFAGPLNFTGVSCPDQVGCPGNGRYRLTVREAGAVSPCPIVCPPGALVEAEDCGDSTNDGCNSDPFASEPLACGDTICGNIFASGGTRDTDWYEVVVTNPAGAVLTADLSSEFSGVAFFVDVPDCANAAVLGEIGFSQCVDGSTVDSAPAVASVGPGTYYLFVSSGNPDGSAIFEGVFCDENSGYVVTLTGDCDGAVCICPGDLDGDCDTDSDDLGILLSAFGSTGAGDLDGDGDTDSDDLGILLSDFGCVG
ncbi:MAG: hypothetical protein ACTS3F_05870 [Phycisphaerales bacterium]